MEHHAVFSLTTQHFSAQFCYFTVTLHVAVFFPAFVVTVIVAVPFLMPLTTPFDVTVAIFLFELFQVTDLLVALEGVTVASNVIVLPFFTFDESTFKFTLFTGIVTVTSHVAVFFLSFVVTVIVALPALTPLIVPSDATVTISASLDFQETDLFVALTD